MARRLSIVVMTGPAVGRAPAIHVLAASTKDIDRRDKHGNDGFRVIETRHGHSGRAQKPKLNSRGKPEGNATRKAATISRRGPVRPRVGLFAQLLRAALVALSRCPVALSP